MTTSPDVGLRHWPLPVLALVVGLILGVGTMLSLYLVFLMGRPDLTDFVVYRDAVGYWLSGKDLYDFTLTADGNRMPFTYPPFAAITMIPTTWLPLVVGWSASAVLQLACLFGLTLLIAARTGVLTGLARPEKVVLVVAGWLALVVSEPSLHGISLGQVSLVLIAVVAVDAVVVPPRWRGLLTGLAAAIKLTPGIFLLYFLVTRQWRAAVNTVVAAVVATAVGFVVLPTQSWRYWTSLLFDTGRVGEPEVVRNKSLLGLLSHLGMSGAGRTAVWVGVSVVVLAVGLWRARSSYHDHGSLAAVISLGLVATVISPISWTHHLVWLPLAGLYLASCPGWRRRVGISLLVGFVGWTPLISYRADIPPGWAIAGDVVSIVLLIGALVGVPRRPGGELEPSTGAVEPPPRPAVAGMQADDL